MGNRAVISFDRSAGEPCIYLHWNGGRASVEAFLAVARNHGVRMGGTRGERVRAMDWIAEQLARHFFACEVGFTVYRHNYGEAEGSASGDNGAYFIGRNLEITGRAGLRDYFREEWDSVKTAEIIEHLTHRVPHFS